MPDLAHADIQGFILRTYAMPALRVFALKVAQPPAARRFLGELVKGAAADPPNPPQLATATDWTVKPLYCLNVGLTYNGLSSLGLPSDSLASFPEEFAAGAAARAERVGDTGRSSPENWIGCLANPDLHVLLFLFAQTEEILEQVTTRLRAMYSNGALSELSLHEARSLPESKAHFGYRDGFAQPTIDGGLPPAMPDVLPKAPAGEFVLGHPSQYADFAYPVPTPSALGENGSFAAFRILAQDCNGFEQFLTEASLQTGLDRELIAAKLCGRWRNGVPLYLSPDSPGEHIPLEKRNSFDYLPSPSMPDAFDDRRGYRCPLGSHIRRMNPRSSVVAGNGGLKHRIIRRGLPYGPPYDPLNPEDGIERGLIGLFIGVSIKDQFEFLMSDWANKGSFAPGLRDTRDPIIGNHSNSGAAFLIPMQGQKRPIALSGLSSFVTCRGAAYCFLPSATAIRYISALPASPA